MFSFEPLDRCLYNGIEFGKISEFVEQRFVLHFGNVAFDNRFFVILGRENIRFFYYDCECPNPQKVINVDFLKELGCISLTNPKDTGYDILHFPQMSCGRIDYMPQLDDNGRVVLEALKMLFHGFPFWKGLDNIIKYDYAIHLWKSIVNRETIGNKNEQISKSTPWKNVISNNPTRSNFKEWNFYFIDNPGWKDVANDSLTFNKCKNILFKIIVKCCFLIFLFEIEDRNEKFAISPLYDHVRKMLRESDVYKLLSAKVQYILYVPQDCFVYNSEEYSYKARKYADGLMSERIKKVIPPENFTGKMRERQGWFYDPEKELENILKENRKQKKGNAAVLKDTLVSKIRSFMYSHHAVDKAMTSYWSKVFFWIAQALMLIGNGVMVTSALFFKNIFWKWYYNHFWVVLLIFIFVFGFIYISGKINRSWATSLFPRILVAEAAAWLTIGIAEDLVKSMLWIEDGLVVFIIIVLTIVGLLIYGESKQHSPYLHKNGNRWKTMLIMNHSLFFALSFGCAMQILFYNNLLKNSDALAAVVYNNHFDQAEKYLHQLENFEKSINDYSQFAREYVFSNADLIANSKSKSRIGGQIVNNGDSAELLLVNQVDSDIKMSKIPVDKMPEFHNILLQNISDNIDIINSNIKCVIDSIHSDSILSCSVSRNEMGLCIESGNNVLQEVAGDGKNDSVIQNNRQWLCIKVAPILKKEIQEVRNHLMNDDYDTLIEWATFDKMKDSSSVEGYINSLTLLDQEKRKCCVNINNTSSVHFFPNLLLLHTLIVLVLAFITQLIISEKSVTEPL